MDSRYLCWCCCFMFSTYVIYYTDARSWVSMLADIHASIKSVTGARSSVIPNVSSSPALLLLIKHTTVTLEHLFSICILMQISGHRLWSSCLIANGVWSPMAYRDDKWIARLWFWFNLWTNWPRLAISLPSLPAATHTHTCTAKTHAHRHRHTLTHTFGRTLAKL